VSTAPPLAVSWAPAGAPAKGDAFPDTVLRYLRLILAPVKNELTRWSARASAIPNEQLRDAATASLAKRGNVEGAALFATLAPSAHRRSTVQALVAFQTAYTYLDTLSELPSMDPLGNARQLHRALLGALQPGAAHADYYALNPQRHDGGYLLAILDACRDALAALPSYGVVAPIALRAAERIGDFQALNLSEDRGGHGALKRWASEATPVGSGLEWWETAAGAGSSLAVHALIAAAAQPGLELSHADEIDASYYPWIGALHSLLDSMVDRREDQALHQRSLLDYYGSSTEAAHRLSALAERARAAASSLPDGATHKAILAGMCSYYLTAPECDPREAREIRRAIKDVLGLPLDAAIAMFIARRLLHTVKRHSYS
jgi:tetraprenyl-beta-curcumene synthase